MESSAAGKCIPHKSKKRVFPYAESKDDASSSSVNRSKNKMHKQNQDDTLVSIRWGTSTSNGISKEVKSYNKGKTLGGVIELDTEDSDPYNGKEYIDLSSDDHDSEFEYPTLGSHLDDTMVSRWGTSTTSAISKEVKSYNKGKTLGGVIELDTEDSDSDNGKEYIDFSSDDYDSEFEYPTLDSHFDDIDLPTGMESTNPCFLDSAKMTSSGTSCKRKGVKTYSDSAKVTKRIAGSSSSRLKKGAMKVKSSKKLAKTQPHKKSIEKSSNVAGTSFVMEQHENDDVSRKYPDFKKFNMVEDYSDHHYKWQSSESMQPPKNWSKEIQKEWRILEKDLPDTIFVRAYESRMDLLRAVIIGAEGTPYHDGLFFFDVCFPKNYPSVPPKVYYHSGGLGINPNLYENGYVCLSLLNTWDGDKNEMWRPGVSTMLQVLVSIQGLILNAKPYFNEPGFEDDSGSPYGENESILYNEQTLICSLKTMVYSMKKPPKHFEDSVIRHFRDRGVAILTTCRGYINGVGVGVEEKGSHGFRKNVERYMGTLVRAFKEIGVEHATGLKGKRQKCN